MRGAMSSATDSSAAPQGPCKERRDTAIALIDELVQMQPASDLLTPQIQVRCASVRQELADERLSSQ